MVGVRQQVVYHEQLSHNLRHIVVPAPGGYGVDHGEGGKSDYHHAEEFQEMVAGELPYARLLLRIAIFFLQTVGTEEQEHGHAVMAEERYPVHGQQSIGVCGYAPQPVYVALFVFVLVLLHHRAKPVAVVVQEDAHYGQSSHGVAFRTCKQ